MSEVGDVEFILKTDGGNALCMRNCVRNYKFLGVFYIDLRLRNIQWLFYVARDFLKSKWLLKLPHTFSLQVRNKINRTTLYYF